MRRRERISANNTSGYIRSLAWRSLKSSRLRNVFVILTIVLSVSLLMVMALFYAGLNTATKRQVEKMQHVIYYGLSEEQLSDMAAKDSPASCARHEAGTGRGDRRSHGLAGGIYR